MSVHKNAVVFLLLASIFVLCVESSAIFGLWDKQETYTVGSPSPRVGALESWTGKKHSAYHIFINFCPDLNWFFGTALESIWQRGYVPVITWEPYCTDINNNWGICDAVAAGSYDTQITNFANRLKTWLGTTRRVYLGLGHEVNGNWYGWSGSPSSYKAMWNRTRSIFNSVGVNNSNRLQWVYVVNAEDVAGCYGNPSCTTPIKYTAEQYYPGSTLVDWIAMDGYGMGNRLGAGVWKNPPDVFNGWQKMLDRIRVMAPNKPIGIYETGCTSNAGANIPEKKLWISDAYSYFVAQNIKMVLWFNEYKPQESQWADYEVFGYNWGDTSFTYSGQTYKAYSSYKTAVQNSFYVSSTASNPSLISDTLFKGSDACIAKTCASLGYTCGSWSDGCGQTLQCGTCSSGSCTSGKCTTCVKATCTSLGKQCGSWSDNCGGTIKCGNLGNCSTTSQACSNGICVTNCVAATCTSLGKNCGSWSNGCGGTLTCGACASGYACSSGKCTASTCSTYATYDTSLAKCVCKSGFYGDGTTCQAMTAVTSDWWKITSAGNWVLAADGLSLNQTTPSLTSPSICVWTYTGSFIGSASQVTFKANVRLNEANAAVGLAFRTSTGTTPKTAYTYVYSPSTKTLRRGNWADPASHNTTSLLSADLTKGTFYTFQVVLKGLSISYYVNGGLKGSYTYSNPKYYGGDVGFYSSGLATFQQAELYTTTSVMVALKGCGTPANLVSYVASVLGVPSSSVKYIGVSTNKCQASTKQLESGSTSVYLELESADGTPSSEALAEILSVESSQGNADFAQIGAEITQVSVGETMPTVAAPAAAAALSVGVIAGIVAGAAATVAVLGSAVAIYIKKRAKDTEPDSIPVAEISVATMSEDARALKAAKKKGINVEPLGGRHEMVSITARSPPQFDS